MITLYGIPRSRSLRVSWTLEELGVDWEYQYIDFSKGDNRREDYLALNPSGKVPTLVDGDLVVTESAAIVVYLAEKYGRGKLLPKPGTADSAMFHQWMSFIICELEQALWTMGKHKFALPEELRQKNMVLVGKYEFDKAAEIAESLLPDTAYLLSEFSVADILLGHTLMWALRFDQTLPPKLQAYMERVTSRSAKEKALGKEVSGSQPDI